MRGKVRSILCCCFMVSVTQLYAQERVITGKVTSKEDGQPVPGVNVVVQGTTRGTTTNEDGSFSLSLAPSDNALTFSFIGYKTQTITLSTQTD